MTESPTPSVRTRILDTAEAAVLAKGFNGTSIDELIAAVGISKSGFFYHFKGKADLARALLERYIDNDNEIFDIVATRAEELVEDPLQSFLVGLKLLAEVFEDLPGLHPGCLVASVCYHEQLFDNEVRDINEQAVRGWRRRFRAHLDRIAEKYPPRIPVDLDDLADMVTVVVDGAIILSRVTNTPSALPKQVLLYRDYIRFIFDPAFIRLSGRNAGN